MEWNTADNLDLLQKLSLPQGHIRMVLDTDTFNEIDDQFALSWALKSPDKITIEAIYAAPFYNKLSTSPKDGMLKSYEEIRRILQLFGKASDGYVYKGSEGYLKDSTTPQPSAAARDLVSRAMETDINPLYVVSIGAITNIASAILLEPRIIDKIVVIWLGGHAYHWPHTREFNLYQDICAARLIFDSGVPLVQIPCLGVASHLSTTLWEIREFVKGRGVIGDYLYKLFEKCHANHIGYSRVIWDMAAIAYLINPEWIATNLVSSPIVTDEGAWSQDASRHFIRCATYVDRDEIFKDFFRKLESR